MVPTEGNPVVLFTVTVAPAEVRATVSFVDTVGELLLCDAEAIVIIRNMNPKKHIALNILYSYALEGFKKMT